MCCSYRHRRDVIPGGFGLMLYTNLPPLAEKKLARKQTAVIKYKSKHTLCGAVNTVERVMMKRQRIIN